MILLCVTVADPGEAWSDVLDALDAVSPLVDDAREGLAYLDMHGIDGTPRDWIARAERVVHTFGLPLRAAVAPNKFAARSAACVAHASVWGEAETRARLAPLPLDLLDVDPKILQRLHLLGVATLGALARLPHGPLVRRFGTAAARWHACARGDDPTPFVPRAHELQIGAFLAGEGAADREELVYFALRVLVDRVCADLARAGKGAARLHVAFECEDGDTHQRDVGMAQSTTDPRAIFDVVRANVEGQRFASPVGGMRLQALQLEELGTPAALFAQREPDPQAIGLALARLKNAVGKSGSQARLQPAHRFEQRFAYGPFTIPRSAATTISQAQAAPQLRLLAARNIDVTVRGGVPVRIDRRAVRDCAGPWRADEERAGRVAARDEYDVLLDDGQLWRIYRDGERWFVGGVYD